MDAEASVLRTSSAQPRRRRNRLALPIAGAWLALGVYLVLTSDGDISDPGWAEIFLFMAPLLAVISSLGAGVVLIVLAALGRARHGTGAAVAGLVVGMVTSPIAYLALAVTLVTGFAALPVALPASVAYGLATGLALWVPVTLGVLLNDRLRTSGRFDRTRPRGRSLTALGRDHARVLRPVGCANEAVTFSIRVFVPMWPSPP